MQYRLGIDTSNFNEKFLNEVDEMFKSIYDNGECFVVTNCDISMYDIYNWLTPAREQYSRLPSDKHIVYVKRVSERNCRFAYNATYFTNGKRPTCCATRVLYGFFESDDDNRDDGNNVFAVEISDDIEWRDADTVASDSAQPVFRFQNGSVIRRANPSENEQVVIDTDRIYNIPTGTYNVNANAGLDSSWSFTADYSAVREVFAPVVTQQPDTSFRNPDFSNLSYGGVHYGTTTIGMR